MLVLRSRLLASLLSPPSLPLLPKPTLFTLSFPTRLSHSTRRLNPTQQHATSASPSKTTQTQPISDASSFVRTVLFVPSGVHPDEVTDDMVLPGSNIVLGPYTGDARIKEVEFVKSSARAKDCPRDDRPEFAILGRSNVGKSALINVLVHKKEVALTSKKPGKTQLINHFSVNKSWYIVDLPGYGFAKAPDVARMDWSHSQKATF